MSSTSPSKDPSSIPHNEVPSTRTTLVLTLLAAMGVPTAIGVAYVSAHPLQALGLGLLWVVGFGLLAYLSKVGKKVGDDLFVDPVAAWLRFQWLRFFSRYWRNYCDDMFHDNKIFDMKGLSEYSKRDLELIRVFVEPRVELLETILPFSSDPLLMPDESDQRGTVNGATIPAPNVDEPHNLWNFLTDPAFTGWHFAIVGPPGSGKTALLRYMVVIMVTGKRPRHAAYMSQKLPLLLFLSEHGKAICDDASHIPPTYTLVSALRSHMQSRFLEGVPSSEWITYQLKQGCFLVMLDGLDDIADRETHDSVLRWVGLQVNAYRNSRFLLTSRPHAYQGDERLDGFVELKIHFFEKSWIEQFVENWYEACSTHDQRSWTIDVHKEASQLLKRLRREEGLWQLARSPLLLTMMVMVHYSGSHLPKRRVELYAAMCDALLKNRLTARRVQLSFDADQARLVLQPLAYYLMQQTTRDIDLEDREIGKIIKTHLVTLNIQNQKAGRVSAPEERISSERFLEIMQHICGLLVRPRHNGPYQFFHRTVQEYLAAAHVAAQVKKPEDINPLIEKIGVAWWEETIRLYCAMGDGTGIIEACLKQNSIAALRLAILCEDEAASVESATRSKLLQLLNLEIESPDAERRKVIANARLEWWKRIREMIILKKEEIYATVSLLTCSEYQLLLDAKKTVGVFLQPDHWVESYFSPTTGHLSVLGLRSADAIAFCQWLTDEDREGWHYRLPRQDECQQIENDIRSMNTLTSLTGYWTNEGKEFRWIRDIRPDLVDIRGKVAVLLKQDYEYIQTSEYKSNMPSLLIDACASVDILIRSFNQGQRDVFEATLATDTALGRIMTRSLDLSHIHTLGSAIDSRSIWLHVPRFDHMQKIAQKLDEVLSLLLSRDYMVRPEQIEQVQSGQGKLDLIFLRWSVRYLARLIALCLHHWSQQLPRSNIWQQKRLSIFKVHRQQDYEQWQRIINDYIDVWVSFTLLELRIQGELPPWEGLLLVKERYQEANEPSAYSDR